MLDLSKNPGFLIRRLQQVSVSIFIECLREFGITPVQYTILRVVQHHPGIDQATLATRSVLDTSTVMDVLRRLEARGLVTRSAGATDRRTRAVALTERAAEILERARPHIDESRAKLLGPLSAAERDQLLRSICKLLAEHESMADGAVQPGPWRRLKKATVPAAEP